MKQGNQTSDVQSQTLPIKWFDSPWFRLLGVTVFALGIFFRISGLGNKIYSHDEVYTSLHAAGYRGGEAFTDLWDGKVKSIDDLQKFLRPNDEMKVIDTLSINALNQPHEAPLFFLIEHYWMRSFGYTPARMRGPAVIFSLLSIPAIYWFSKEMFLSSQVALLSSIIFAISPYEILFAQDARPYSLLALVTMLSSAALLQSIRRDSRNNWILYCLTMIIGMYSHLLFIFVAITHILYVLIMQLVNNKKGISKFLWACTIAILTYVPWIFMIALRWEHAALKMEWAKIQIPWFRYVQRWMLLFSSPLMDVDLNSDIANFGPYFVRALIIAFIVYAFLYLMKHSSRSAKLFLPLFYFFTVGIFIVLDLLLGGIRSISGRYFGSASIATIMVIAYFLTKKLNRGQRDKSGAKVKYILFLLILIGIVSNINSLLSETWWNKELGRIRTEFVHEINRDQTLLIVSGIHPTNLGDVLLLGFSIDQDVHFIFNKDVPNIEYPLEYKNVYWFPGSYADILKISSNDQFIINNILPDTLWKITIRNQ